MLKLFRVGAVSLCFSLSSTQILALETGIKGFTVDGRARQGYSVLYDLDQGGLKRARRAI